MTDRSTSITELTATVESIFLRAGLNQIQSAACARTIVAGERDACKSHGIYRIEGALRTVAAGKANPIAQPRLVESDAPTIIRIDARGGFATPALELGVPLLVDATTRFGLAALVINDCVHFSALSYEIEMLTERGLAAMAMCPSYATVAPAGGIAPLLGTNPLAFGWPRPGTHPYVFDIATSVAARGEIELHRKAGTPLPEGWAIDDQGHPTTDPVAALAGAMLPFGGHKGSAIGTMIELLSASMIGDLTSRQALDELGTTTLNPRHGELVLAFDPAKFAAGRAIDPLESAEKLFDAILGQGARLPSQRRFAAREVSLRDGIALSAAEIAELDRLGEFADSIAAAIA